MEKGFFHTEISERKNEFYGFSWFLKSRILMLFVIFIFLTFFLLFNAFPAKFEKYTLLRPSVLFIFGENRNVCVVLYVTYT